MKTWATWGRGRLRPRLASAGLALAAALVGCGEETVGADERAQLEALKAELAALEAESTTPEPPAPPVSPVVAPEAAPAAPAGPGAPRIQSVRLEPAEPVADAPVRAVVEASDPEGDPIQLRYDWTLDGEPAGGGNARLLLQGAAKGQRIEVTVVASDRQGESLPVGARATVHNRPPRIARLVIEPSGEISAGLDIVVRPEGADADGDGLSFRYDWTVDEREIDHDGPVLPTASLLRGTRVGVSVVASDGEDESEPLASPSLLIANAPPRIVSQPGRPSADGVFRYRVEASDPDGDVELQFALTEAPSGMAIDPLNGQILWRPGPGQLGTHPVVVVVDDLHGGQTQHSFEVQVAGADSGFAGAAAPAP